MTKYEKSSEAVAKFVATHTTQQLVEQLKQSAPYAFPAPDAPRQPARAAPKTSAKKK